jgi:hypothetical protein
LVPHLPWNSGLNCCFDGPGTNGESRGRGWYEVNPAKFPDIQAAEQLATQLHRFPVSRQKKTENAVLFMLDSVTNQIVQIPAEPEPVYLYCGSSE